MRLRIQQLLQDYQPSDSADAQLLAQCVRLLSVAPEPANASSANPWDRSHFTPGHFTASAFVLDEALAHTLLVRHRKLQRWLQPGGHIEADKDGSPHAAAWREVVEECELQGSQLQDWPSMESPRLLDIDIHEIPAYGEEPAHRHYDLRFAVVTARDRQVQAFEGRDPGILALRWWPLAGLGDALRAAGEVVDVSILRAVQRVASTAIH